MSINTKFKNLDRTAERDINLFNILIFREKKFNIYFPR